MSNRKFYTQRWEQDLPAFVRVLNALPADKIDYKPHERSTGAGDLAWQLAEELRVLSEVDDRGAINWDSRPRPSTMEEIAAAYEANAARLREVLESMDDAKWDGEARFLFGGQEAWKSTVGDIFWGFFLDSIHHRGQLSAYIRPMGGKVPSIYGPSADDSGGM
jgi:uncharacterized damage-inducible protein DinB